jgi:hypothetical protein
MIGGWRMLGGAGGCHRPSAGQRHVLAMLAVLGPRELPLPVVEQARLQLVLVADVRDRDLVDQMLLQHAGLLLAREVPPLCGHAWT